VQGLDSLVPNESSRVLNTRKHVLALEPAISLQDGRDVVAGGKHTQYVLHGEPPTANDGLTPEDCRIHDDSGEKVSVGHLLRLRVYRVSDKSAPAIGAVSSSPPTRSVWVELSRLAEKERAAVLAQERLALLPLPGMRAGADYYADLRSAVPIELDTVKACTKVAPMTEDGEIRLCAQLVAYFTRRALGSALEGDGEE